MILSALLFFTCPLQVYYDLTLALFEIRSSHSSISLSFNTYAFRFSDCIVSSSWSLLPLSILSTRALSTQPYQHHFPDSSASQTRLASITQRLEFPYFVCLLVSLKMKIDCVHVYLLVLFYSLRRRVDSELTYHVHTRSSANSSWGNPFLDLCHKSLCIK